MKKRYSQLQPLSIEEQEQLSLDAISFFSGVNNRKHREQLKLTINHGVIEALTIANFLNWLQEKYKQDFYAKQQKIVELLGLLSSKRLLIDAGRGQGSPPFNYAYYCMPELSKIEQKGRLFLGKYLGLQFIAHTTKTNIASITGRSNGDEHMGSGVLISPNIVLTCAHVLNDMTLDKTININGFSYRIDDSESHPIIDLGVIIIKDPMRHEICNDIALRNSTILEPIVISGFPKVPRKIDSSAMMQRGEIAGKIKSYGEKGEIDLELFTVISRPGNSGGPLLGEDGKLVGIVTLSLERQKEEIDRENQILPCFAAIPASEILKAFNELSISKYYKIPWEDYQ